MDRESSSTLTCTFTAASERANSSLAAKLTRLIDGEDHAIIALDEGSDGDEIPPDALTERLALFVDLDGIPLAQSTDAKVDAAKISAARTHLPQVSLTEAQSAELVQVAACMGISSFRPPMFTRHVARVICALSGRDRVISDDLLAAVELTLARHATAQTQPESDTTDTPPDVPEPQNDQGDIVSSEEDLIPAEILLEAAKSALPTGVLAELAAGKAARARSGASGTGAVRKGNRRGRPLPSRPGRLDGQSHIDLVATLRAAAPWQPMRRAVAPRNHLIHIRPSDIRIKRYEEKSDRILIFAVDASGSAAMARLAEAKGAVEILLSEAYARRDHVALVSFRGQAAEVGEVGDGTPLAAGLEAAMHLATQSRARGMTPSIAVLTDGRANIALDGTANRQAAAADLELIARRLRSEATPAIVIDTGVRPQASLRHLAELLDSPYVPLPRADAARLSQAVAAGLAD